MKPDVERFWRWENEINPKLCKEIIELAEDNWSTATTYPALEIHTFVKEKHSLQMNNIFMICFSLTWK